MAEMTAEEMINYLKMNRSGQVNPYMTFGQPMMYPYQQNPYQQQGGGFQPINYAAQYVAQNYNPMNPMKPITGDPEHQAMIEWNNYQRKDGFRAPIPHDIDHRFDGNPFLSGLSVGFDPYDNLDPGPSDFYDYTLGGRYGLPDELVNNCLARAASVWGYQPGDLVNRREQMMFPGINNDPYSGIVETGPVFDHSGRLQPRIDGSLSSGGLELRSNPQAYSKYDKNQQINFNGGKKVMPFSDNNELSLSFDMTVDSNGNFVVAENKANADEYIPAYMRQPIVPANQPYVFVPFDGINNVNSIPVEENNYIPQQPIPQPIPQQPIPQPVPQQQPESQITQEINQLKAQNDYLMSLLTGLKNEYDLLESKYNQAILHPEEVLAAKQRREASGYIVEEGQVPVQQQPVTQRQQNVVNNGIPMSNEPPKDLDYYRQIIYNAAASNMTPEELNSKEQVEHMEFMANMMLNQATMAYNEYLRSQGGGV